MRLPDTNVLVFAVNRSAALHHRSVRWLDAALSGATPVGFAWLALIGFVRISTHPTINPHPLTADQAMAQVEAWLSSPSAHVLQPGPTHAVRLRALLADAGAAANLTNDAHLAALAVEHKATVVTWDSDFGRFPGVPWEQPR